MFGNMLNQSVVMDFEIK